MKKLSVIFIIIIIIVCGCSTDKKNDIDTTEEIDLRNETEIKEETEAETEAETEIETKEVIDEVIIDNNQDLTYKIVDTGLVEFFTDESVVSQITETSVFYGQDAHYVGNQPSYKDNADKTVSDLVTGLMWQQTMDTKMTYEEAIVYANESMLGGHDDWRIPSIKELFSLIIFSGVSGGETAKKLFIDTDYFDQPLGDISIGEREIDAQVWSSTIYTGITMNKNETVFGVNFIDGRIKGYNLTLPRGNTDNKGYFRLVRGNTSYGKNTFVDNGDGTISDLATGLMWQAFDDGQVRNWEEALSYSEELALADYSDWRLPNAKELQSIVDYSKSLQATNSPAIDDMFTLSKIIDANGDTNYGFYWTGTTHQDGRNTADSASYIAFGEALGKMNEVIMDVHGAGAVRSDPKAGNPNDYPTYVGPQGDVRYTFNHVLAVRDIEELPNNSIH